MAKLLGYLDAERVDRLVRLVGQRVPVLVLARPVGERRENLQGVK